MNRIKEKQNMIKEMKNDKKMEKKYFYLLMYLNIMQKNGKNILMKKIEIIMMW